mgnify:CR=1 FL=1
MPQWDAPHVSAVDFFSRARWLLLGPGELDGIARVETAPAVLGTVRNRRVMWPVDIVVR